MRISAFGLVHTAWLLLLFQSCASVPQEPYPGTAPERTPFIFELHRQDIELDETDFESDAGFNSSDRDLDARRNSLMFGFGNDALRGYATVFQENLKYQAAGNKLEGDGHLGIGAGIMGAPGFARIVEKQFRLVVPYRTGVSVAVGEWEAATGTGFESSNGDEYFSYDAEGEVGFGVEWRGLRISTGLYGRLYVINSSDDANTDLDGLSIGPYADIRFKDDEYPIYVSGRVMGGDVKQGFLVSVGTYL